jgi:transcription initiation factor IIE alpha subunit
MKNRFLCPSCRSDLKIKNSVIFSAQTEKGLKGLILLSPELGNYSILHVPGFSYAEGEHIDFFCPVCHADLGIHKVSKDLAGVIMIDENKDEYHIVFSEIAGKKCTIKMKENSIIESYGENADEFSNFWGEGPKY